MWRSFVNAGISKGKYLLKICRKLIGIAHLNWHFFRPENNKMKWYIRTENTTEKKPWSSCSHYQKDVQFRIFFFKLFSLANVPGIEQPVLEGSLVSRYISMIVFSLWLVSYSFWSCHRSLQPRQEFSHLFHSSSKAISFVRLVV